MPSQVRNQDALSWQIICWCLCLANLDNFLSLMDLLDLLGQQTLNTKTSSYRRLGNRWIKQFFLRQNCWTLSLCHCANLCSLIARSQVPSGSVWWGLGVTHILEIKGQQSGNKTIWTPGANSELRCQLLLPQSLLITTNLSWIRAELELRLYV